MMIHATSLRRLALAALATLLLAALPVRAHAAFMLTIMQSGNDVVVNGTGSFNLTALTLVSSGSASGGDINPSKGLLRAGPPVGPETDDVYNGGGLTGPATFGTGAGDGAASGTGGIAGIGGFGPYLYVPAGYTSGTALTDSATFTNNTLATLGFTSGTYTYTWGSAANGTADSLTIVTGMAVVPEPSTWTLLALGAAGLGLLARRRRRMVPARA